MPNPEDTTLLLCKGCGYQIHPIEPVTEIDGTVLHESCGNGDHDVYVKLSSTPIVKTVGITDHIHLDLNMHREPVGVELLNIPVNPGNPTVQPTEAQKQRAAHTYFRKATGNLLTDTSWWKKPATASINDVAAYVLTRSPHGLSTMKLHKLLWLLKEHTTLLGSPMFTDQFLAKRTGPVCLAILEKHDAKPVVYEWPAGNPGNLSNRDETTIRSIYDKYGVLSGPQLSKFTTRPGTPWAAAFATDPEGRGDAVITDQMILAAHLKQATR